MGSGDCYFLLVVAVLTPLIAAGHTASSPPEVEVIAGKLRGKWHQTDSGRAIAAFEGIPYAQPPVGALRFKSPQPTKPWAGVRAADRFGADCLQRNIIIQSMDLTGSEDCLYMNVYSPETVSRAKLLPVMVYVHGGGFIAGSGSLHGPEMLLDRDVLLVNFNYRLGPLGFLSSADDVIPGNFGLKDQVLALKWVRDNIRAFGGDPDQVTIFGESAGGACVHFLMLSPLSRGLFHRAVAMSGNAAARWAFRDPALVKKQVDIFARAVECPAQPSKDLLGCLAGKTAAEIQGTDLAFLRWAQHPLVPFRPTVEPSGPDAFLDRHPRSAAEEASDVPFMTGFTTDEGCLIAAPIFENLQFTQDLNERASELMPVILDTSHLPENVNAEIYSRILEFYLGGKPPGMDNQRGFLDLMTDVFFAVSTLEAVKLHKVAAKSPVFLYELGHISERSWATMFGAKKATYGMCHADDLLYLFPLRALLPQEPSASDKAFAQQMLNLFTTFAVTGMPTTDGSWPAVENPAHAEYVHTSEAGSLLVRRGFAEERVRFWASLPFNVALNLPSVLDSTTRDEL